MSTNDTVQSPPSDYDFDGRRQHAFNKLEWHVPKGLRGRFLDIGCGPGNGVVAALQQGFEMAVGIDRDFDEFAVREPFDTTCRRYGVNPQRGLLLEADIFQTRFPAQSFDCVLFLDSIEHVPNPASFVDYAARCLAPGGVLLLDTCPLYYSRVGHHLFNYFDAQALPWAHLRHDFDALVAEKQVEAWSMQRFHELNRVTHRDIVRMFEAAGLKIVEQHRAVADDAGLALLEQHRPHLKLDGIDPDTLFEDWILLVGQR